MWRVWRDWQRITTRLQTHWRMNKCWTIFVIFLKSESSPGVHAVGIWLGSRFFYRHICQREVQDRFGLPPRRGEKKLPIVLSIEQVTRLLSCIDNLKHRVLLKTTYSAGLRVSEVVRLKPHHIESDPSRMLIRVEQGKGKKDRYTVLSKKLLKELRLYWKKYRPEKWLFPGYGYDKHLSTTAASQIFYHAKKKPV